MQKTLEYAKSLNFLTFLNLYMGIYVGTVMIIQNTPNPVNLGNFLAKAYYGIFVLFQKVSLLSPFLLALMLMNFDLKNVDLNQINRLVYMFLIYGSIVYFISWLLQVDVTMKESQSQIFDSGELFSNKTVLDTTFGGSKLTQFRYYYGILLNSSASGCFAVSTVLSCFYYYIRFFS